VSLQEDLLAKTLSHPEHLPAPFKAWLVRYLQSHLDFPSSGSGGSDDDFVGEEASVFNVKEFLAVGDGTTDDTTAIQAAITAASAVGGTVLFPAGAYKITSTLTISSPVTIQGAGMHQYLFSDITNTNGTILHWYGAAGGTMIRICPSVGASLAIAGPGIKDIALNGRATSTSTGAAFGIRMTATTQGIFRNLYITECTTADIKTEWNSDGTYTGLNFVYQCAFENIWLYNNLSGGDCLYLSGHGSGAGLDTSFCTFSHMHCTHFNGNGIVVQEADSNYFYMIACSQGSGVGSHGVIFKASPSVGHGAVSNAFFGLWPGQGGVYAEGTPSNTSPSTKNAIYGYEDQDGVPDPVVEAGANLYVLKQSGDSINYGGSNHSIGDGASVVDYRDAYGASVAQVIYGRRARGSLAAPRRAKMGDSLWGTLGFGFYAADDVSTAVVNPNASARIRFAASEDHTSTAQGGYFAFDTIATGATSLVERIQIDSLGINLEGLKARGSGAATTNGDLLRYEQVIGQYLPLGIFPASGALKDFKVFNAGTGQTWSKPGSGTVAMVFVKGASAGGGSGITGSSGTSLSGGGGGGAGGWVAFAVSLAALASSVNVDVATGGSSGTAGNPGGSASGTTAFDTSGGNASVTAATGGSAGSSGTATGGSGGVGTAPTYTGYEVTSSVATGGAGGGDAAGATGGGGTNGGGGGGGGFTSTGPAGKGGGVGANMAWTSTGSGTGGSLGTVSSATNGAPGLNATFIPASMANAAGGGGGGGASGGAGKNAGNGANGTSGGGGGGGGSCVTGGVAGTGGAGVDGCVVVLVF
jgi:hypothetical protein